MIFNISRFFHSFKIFIEYLLCVLYICLQNHPENEKLSPFYKGDIQKKLKFTKIAPTESDQAEIQMQACQMLQPMLLPIRSSTSSDTEDPGMALDRV